MAGRYWSRIRTDPRSHTDYRHEKKKNPKKKKKRKKVLEELSEKLFNKLFVQLTICHQSSLITHQWPVKPFTIYISPPPPFISDPLKWLGNGSPPISSHRWEFSYLKSRFSKNKQLPTTVPTQRTNLSICPLRLHECVLGLHMLGT